MNFVNMIKSTINQVKASDLIGSELVINNITVSVDSKIATGGYGIIYSASDRNGKKYAVKALQAPDEEHYQDIVNEFEIQNICSKHKNVVKVYGMLSDKSTRQAIILMEFCSENLVSIMNQNFQRGFDDKTIVEIFQQVTEAVDFIHSQNPPIVHRDLKPENVLRNEGMWKLCDFGSATRKIYHPRNNHERNEASDDLEKNTTPLYRAPEMCDLYRGQTIGTKADVWALGCILFKLCTFKDAFPEGSNLQILNMKYKWPNEKNVNEKFKDIVKFIFVSDPEKRPTAEQVLAELYRNFPQWVDSKWESYAKNQQSEITKNHDKLDNGKQSNNNTFDPFNNQTNNDTFDPFNNQSKSNTFNSFNNQSKSNTYDPFNNQSNNNTFNSFNNQSNNNTFNSFSNQTNNDTFNSFNNQSNSNTFVPFNKASKPVSSQPDKSEEMISLLEVNSNNDILSDANDKITTSSNSDINNYKEFQDISNNSVYHLDIHKLETNPESLIKEILEMNESDLSSALNSIISSGNSSFLLNLLHYTGSKVSNIINKIPNITGSIGSVIESRKSFTSKFPQFDGNFSLTNFLLLHKTNPVPIGQPPICVEAVNELQNHIDQVITLLRKQPCEIAGKEIFISYQITAFLLAKLKQFKINESYVVNISIPRFQNQFSQIQRAIANSNLKIAFPNEQFNFSDQTFLKKIRPPAIKKL